MAAAIVSVIALALAVAIDPMRITATMRSASFGRRSRASRCMRPMPCGSSRAAKVSPRVCDHSHGLIVGSGWEAALMALPSISRRAPDADPALHTVLCWLNFTRGRQRDHALPLAAAPAEGEPPVVADEVRRRLDPSPDVQAPR